MVRPMPATSRHRTLGGAALVLTLTLPAAASASERFDGWDFYFGDLHAHSGASGDGYSSDMGQGCAELGGELQPCGETAAIVEIAREHGLDFMAVTDHVNGRYGSDPTDFDDVLDLVMSGHDPDQGFLTIPAGEIYTGHHGKVGGHLNLYFFAENTELFDLHLQDFTWGYNGEAPVDTVQDCGTLWRWMAQLEEDFGPVLILPHHPQMAQAMATNWACHSRVYPESRRYAPAVEIYSRHGDNTVMPTEYDPLWGADTEALHDLSSALDPEGWSLRLGLLAGTDAHDTQPGAVCANSGAYLAMQYGGGLAVVVLPEGEAWTRTALHEAIGQRHSYATSGPMLPVVLEYRVDGQRLGGMGDEIDLPSDATLEAELRIPAALEHTVESAHLITPEGSLSLAPQGDGIFGASISPDKRPAWAYARLLLDGERWYGQAGCDDGGANNEERIWLSPTWFDPINDESPDPDTGVQARQGCRGCSGRRGAVPGRALLLLAGLIASARRRLRPIIVRSW